MDPPGKKLKREDTSGSEEESEDKSEEEMTDLDRWLVDPQSLKDEQEEEDYALLERFGDPDQQAEAIAWRKKKEEKQKMQDKEEEGDIVDKIVAKTDNETLDDNDQADAKSVNSTDTNFAEIMLGGKMKCIECGKFPCEWFSYSLEAHNLFFEKGGKPGQLAPPFNSKSQREYRFELYNKMEALHTNGMPRGDGKRYAFPNCVMEQVKLLFPDPNNEYSGFKNKKRKL